MLGFTMVFTNDSVFRYQLALVAQLTKQELDDLWDKLQPLAMKYRKEKQRIDENKATEWEKLRIDEKQKWEKLFDVQKAERSRSRPDSRSGKSGTGIPVTRLGQNDKETLVGLGDRLHKRVVGQDQAVEAVAEAVLRSRADLGRQQQPTGSFLFLGPTGVGKIELAKWFDIIEKKQ
ncbi:hypothetical protein QQ045_028275 [Rhodiola kirilowii]